MENSGIASYFRDKSIFLTGGTGFIGKVLIEKLLRSCPDLKCIYVLVRGKRNQTPNERLDDFLQCALFETIRLANPRFRAKLVALNGDLLLPDLGLSDVDRQVLVDNCNIVFHSAATLRFDEPLKLAVEMNIIAVAKMIALAKQMRKLDVFVHVSTAYANCDRRHVSEIVYNPPIQPKKILEAVDWMEADLIELLTPRVIKKRPNTYTYTKAIAECLVFEAGKELPSVIVRPSIVCVSWREPFPGWIDNYNGPTAIIVGVAKGVVHVMPGNRNAIADLIPVDVVVNLMIATAWYKGTQRTSETLVFNCTSGQINPIQWGKFEKLLIPLCLSSPYDNVFLVPFVSLTSSVFVKNMRVFFYQTLPAYCADLYLRLVKQKPFNVRTQLKIQKIFKILEYFTSNEWEFTNDNVLMLGEQLNVQDAQDFNFNIKSLNWTSFIEQYYLGTKKYLLHENMDNTRRNRKKMNRIRIILSFARLIGALLVAKFLFFRRVSFSQAVRVLFALAVKVANSTVLKLKF
jgi:fatty acyl-CoA reductase